MPGDFRKYLNNSMDQKEFPHSDDHSLKIFAFAHFTFEHGKGNFMVTDLQGEHLTANPLTGMTKLFLIGVGMNLTDPEIATKRSFVMAGGTGEM